MSEPDRTTLEIYNRKASDYADRNEIHLRQDPRLEEFIAACPPGGQVLDLGCGPGTSSAVMASAGLRPLAMDASAEMIALADQLSGVQTQLASFDDLSGIDIYDGVWANFSLLHASRADFPRHLRAIRQALRSGGPFYIALKLGKGEARDALGRLYTYYEDNELKDLLRSAGFTPTNSTTGESVGLDGSMARWISVACHG
ncbi:class I SAM-dependent DNA methyltransferase [Phaeobacter inhibens]|uniref:class I SAM-dependent DNA methyltransferase n=1 Tax=Phaeobacter inhibens TaxID=221822 RepID=UPI000C99D875|nr:class I SAM-dependent methyltransferase [Phaeobacter inhibens]AUR09233.1 putative methyltransferase [Phaeobacter inhibens]